MIMWLYLDTLAVFHPALWFLRLPYIYPILMDFFYSPRSFHIAFILPINYKLYVFKWRLLSKVQVFVQKPKFVHLPLGFFGSLATTSIIPINVLSCLNKSANISLSFRNFIQNIT